MKVTADTKSGVVEIDTSGPASVFHAMCGLTDEQVERACRIVCLLTGTDPEGTDPGFMRGKAPLWMSYIALVRQQAAIELAIQYAPLEGGLETVRHMFVAQSTATEQGSADGSLAG